MNDNLAQRVGWVLWPSFLVACAAELLFFSFVDPADVHVFGSPLEADRMVVYSAGFFVFWAMGAMSSALTVFLSRSPFEINRCTLKAEDRPAGCPKRCEPDAAAALESLRG